MLKFKYLKLFNIQNLNVVNHGFNNIYGNNIVGFNIIDNTYYNPFGTGVNNGSVNTMINYKDVLYVGGIFSSVNGNAIDNISAFDLVSEIWLSLFGSGLSTTIASMSASEVFALLVANDVLYIGGNFRIVDGSTFDDYIHGLIAFDIPTSTWFNPFGYGLAQNTTEIIYMVCRTMSYCGNILYIGGDFYRVNGNI